MNKWLTKISGKQEKKITAVNVEFHGEGNYYLHALKFEKRKKGIRFDFFNEEVHDFAQAKKIWKKETALAVTFSGRGIITRKIEKREDFKFSLKQVIPNASEEDFYFQSYETENYLLVTVIRKTQADPVLEQLKNNGFLLAGFYLGATPAYSLGVITGKNEIKIKSSKITLDENEVFEVIPTNEEAVEEIIDEKKISADLLLAVGTGFAYFLSSEGWSDVQSGFLDHSKEELSYKRLVSNVGFGSLAVLLIVLLFNQNVLNHYQERQVLLETILSNTATERTDLQEAKKELQQKQELVASTGLFNPVQLSFYADRIAAEVPSEVILSELSVYPLKKKKLNSSEKAEFTMGEIMIQGKVENTAVLNEWVKTIKENDWAKEVTIDKYNDSENAFANFTVNIKVG